MVGDWSEDLRVSGGKFSALTVHALADMIGLRNTALPSHAVHSTNLVRCPPCILRYPPWIDHRHVPDQRYHLQRDPPATQEGATGLAIALRVLSTVQDRIDMHQCRKLLLVSPI
jgi:hypothetical protein